MANTLVALLQLPTKIFEYKRFKRSCDRYKSINKKLCNYIVEEEYGKFNINSNAESKHGTRNIKAHKPNDLKQTKSKDKETSSETELQKEIRRNVALAKEGYLF